MDASAKSIVLVNTFGAKGFTLGSRDGFEFCSKIVMYNQERLRCEGHVRGRQLQATYVENPAELEAWRKLSESELVKFIRTQGGDFSSRD